MYTHNQLNASKGLCGVRYIRYQIRNVASAQEWDFTAQMLWWFCAVVHLRGNTGHQRVCAIW